MTDQGCFDRLRQLLNGFLIHFGANNQERGVENRDRNVYLEEYEDEKRKECMWGFLREFGLEMTNWTKKTGLILDHRKRYLLAGFTREKPMTAALFHQNNHNYI